MKRGSGTFRSKQNSGTWTPDLTSILSILSVSRKMVSRVGCHQIMWMWSHQILRLHRPGTRFPTSRHRGPGAVVRHASGCVKEMIMTRTLALDPAATTYIFALLWCRLCISILSSGCGGTNAACWNTVADRWGLCGTARPSSLWNPVYCDGCMDEKRPNSCG